MLSFWETVVDACSQNSVLSFDLCIFLAICFIEKGKLKHATVTPEPGETKDIRSYKVGHLFSLALYIILWEKVICGPLNSKVVAFVMWAVKFIFCCHSELLMILILNQPLNWFWKFESHSIFCHFFLFYDLKYMA